MSVLRTIWRFVKLEVQLYVALGRWVARRPHVPTGAPPWGYSRMVTPVMWLWIFGSAMELPLVHVLIPWDGVRLALLGVGVWGLVWMIGTLASLKVYPHLADADGLRVRYGKLADMRVPWSAVASVAAVDRDLEWSLRSHRPLETPDGIDLQVPVNDRANVHVRLAEPTTVSTPSGPLDVTALTFWVDEPRTFAARANVHGSLPRAASALSAHTRRVRSATLAIAGPGAMSGTRRSVGPWPSHAIPSSPSTAPTRLCSPSSTAPFSAGRRASTRMGPGPTSAPRRSR